MIYTNMDELIDIVDIEGKPTGDTCLKNFAHQHGILHASVHIWLYTKNNEVLIQKRHPNKKIFPNLWDVSVAGHLEAGETSLAAAVREVKEEIGFTISDQKLAYKSIWHEQHKHQNGIVDNEVHYLYFAELTQNITSLKIQQEEVSDIKLTHIEAFQNHYHNQKVFVPHSFKYYQYIINTLKTQI